MAHFARNPDKKTYYSVGWTAHGSRSGVFWDVSMSGGAIESAGKKLRELSHGSGRRRLPYDA
jgi:hypothetical protein